MNSASDQECPFKASVIVPIYCALIFIVEWSWSMWDGFVWDKTKLENELQAVMAI